MKTYKNGRVVIAATWDELKQVKNWQSMGSDSRGDRVQVGSAGDKWYVMVTNDGYPNRFDAGGYAFVLPEDVIVDGKPDRDRLAGFIDG